MDRLKYVLWVLLFPLCFAILTAACPVTTSHCPIGQTCPPVSVAYRVMPLGDSITYGVDGSGATNNGGYRGPLWNDLGGNAISTVDVGSQQSGPAGSFQNNEGHSGWRIDQISASVVGWLTTYQPRVVLLHIGTNDIEQNYNVANMPARLNSLINQVTSTSPSAIVVVAQILPLANQALNSDVQSYNSAIPGIVQSDAASGKHVYMADMYDAVPASLLPDGIHPSTQGYSQMATVWNNALVPLLPKNYGIG